MDGLNSVQSVVTTLEYRKVVEKEISQLVKDRRAAVYSEGKRFKRSPFDSLIGDSTKSSKRLALDFVSLFVDILEKKSNLPFSQRVYIKSLCDLCLHKFLESQLPLIKSEP